MKANHVEMPSEQEIERTQARDLEWVLKNAISEIEWLHAQAGITTGDCHSIRLIRYALEDLTGQKARKPERRESDPRWEAVPDDPHPDDEKGGRFWRVRWSEEIPGKGWLYVGHYGGNGSAWNQNAAERHAQRLNDQARSPWEWR